MFIIIIAVAFLFIFNPFSKNQAQRMPPPYIKSDRLEILKNYFLANYKEPEQFIAATFSDRDIVFLAGIGDSSIIKEHVEFIQQLIPVLHRSGVYDLGIEYALHEDQERIDALLSTATYNENTVREILFNRYVPWGYQEYADIFKTAWELNRNLPDDAEPFRLVGLSVRSDWHYLQTEKDIEDNAIKKKILSRGLPSVFMAEIIRREFIDRERKALIFCNPQQVFTSYRNKKYAENTLESGFNETRCAGNIVYDLIHRRAATVLLHYIWPDEKATYSMSRPFSGAMDAVMAVLPEDQIRGGVKTENTPFGDLAIENNILDYGYESLTLKDICDGYIILEPLHLYTPVTPIANFITEENLEAAKYNFPAPKDNLPSLGDAAKDAMAMNQMIGGYIQNTPKILAMFKYP